MTAKEFLNQYRNASNKAKRLHYEYIEELAMIDSIKSLSELSDMPHGSGISKPTEDKAIQLTDKAARWKMAELDALHVRQVVFETVNEIPGIEGEVLCLRYVNLRKWEDIASALDYSEQGVYKIHQRGLDIVEVMINDEGHRDSE